MKFSMWCILALFLIGAVKAVDILPGGQTASQCICGDQLATIQAQQTLSEKNIEAYMAMVNNQTQAKLDAQRVYMNFSFSEGMSQLERHVDQKIIDETTPWKFTMSIMFAALGFAGLLFSSYIALGG